MDKFSDMFSHAVAIGLFAIPIMKANDTLDWSWWLVLLTAIGWLVGMMFLFFIITLAGYWVKS